VTGPTRTTDWSRPARYDRDRDPVEFGRIVGLSDDVFAVALTLLVISIVVTPGLSSGEFATAILSLASKFVITAVSVLVVASAWLQHHRLFRMLQRADGGLVRRNIALLGIIAFVPFPHAVLANYLHEPLAYVLYAAVLAAANAMELVLFTYALSAASFRVEPTPAEAQGEVRRHVLTIAGFLASMPLSFVLVGLTPVIWAVLPPLERVIARRGQRARASRPRTEPPAGPVV
jgi:uncharacterized membrane protein